MTASDGDAVPALSNALTEVLAQLDEPSDDTAALMGDDHDALLADFMGSLRAAVLQRASDWCADNGVPDVTRGPTAAG